MLIVTSVLDAANVGVGVGVATFVVAIVVAARVAEFDLHRLIAALIACCKSAALQLVIKQFAAAVLGMSHWQDSAD